MVSDGTLKSIFYSYYTDDLKQANIGSRKVIAIPNVHQPEKIPFDRPEL
jgi:hypothetical protein